ncbi:hypothetical protein ACLKOZ_06925 [Arthrobacter sp. R4]|uniref:hypothetical protein n=1 Tax=Arthrobacter sp. R4 TaxID=644417 RepID=UPI003ED93D61
MALRIHHTWHPVIGQRVQMRRGGIIVREGIVDAVTLDDSILWIAGGGLEPRAMFQRTDGFEVWLNYQWESQ